MNKCNGCKPIIKLFNTNNLSTKMIQSQMIHLKRRNGISVVNTRIGTIYENIYNGDYDINKKMLLTFKINLYMRYFNAVVSCNLTTEYAMKLRSMLEYIIVNLTESEYNIVYSIKIPPPPPVIDLNPITEYTFYVIVRNNPPYNYFIIKNMIPSFILKAGKKYTFDLSDPSNLGTQFALSYDKSGIYTTDSYYMLQNITNPDNSISTVEIKPGNPNAKLIYTSPIINYNTCIYVFNNLDRTTSNTLLGSAYKIWGYYNSYIVTDFGSYLAAPSSSTYFIKSVTQNCTLAVFEQKNGPQYFINNNDELILKLNLYQYAFTYGTYYITVPITFQAALLNHGLEKYISFSGTNMSSDILKNINLDDNASKDGSYNFYWGNVVLSVYRKFPTNLSFYSKFFGFIYGMNLLKFDEPYNVNSPIAVPVDTNIVKTTYGSIPLSLYNTITYVNRIDSSGNPILVYDSDGNVINLNSVDNIIPILYDVYGNIIPNDSSFNPITIINYKKNLDYKYNQNITLPYAPTIFNYVNRIDSSSNPIHGLCAQNKINIYDGFITFNDDTTTGITYKLAIGEYLFFIDPSQPISFLNSGKEHIIMIENLTSNNEYKNLAPDNNSYTFYYGVVRVTIKANFGSLSVSTLKNGYLGTSRYNSGYNIFSYDASYSNHISYPDQLSIPDININPLIDKDNLASNPEWKDIPNYSPLLLYSSDITYSADILYSKIRHGNISNFNKIYVDTGFYIITDNTTQHFYSLTSRYEFTNPGVYLFQCLNNEFAIMNKNIETSISYTGGGSINRKLSTVDNNYYDYFRDYLIVYVYKPFGFVSMDILGKNSAIYGFCFFPT
jgi:hypothetical protein